MEVTPPHLSENGSPRSSQGPSESNIDKSKPCLDTPCLRKLHAVRWCREAIRVRAGARLILRAVKHGCPHRQ
jgi:hypothetical protein